METEIISRVGAPARALPQLVDVDELRRTATTSAAAATIICRRCTQGSCPALELTDQAGLSFVRGQSGKARGALSQARRKATACNGALCPALPKLTAAFAQITDLMQTEG